MKTKAPKEPPSQQNWVTPVMYTIIGGILFAILYLLYFPPILAWAVDILAFGATFFIGLALVSQFVLPVTTAEERTRAYSRLRSYVSGSHGPIMFVRNGELIASASELTRRGPGVVLVDSTSGVVIEYGHRFSRAVGPGITFLEEGERVKQTLDLRKQSRQVETSALTRDGIEIATTLTVVFGLQPGEQFEVQSPMADESDLFLSARILPAYPFNPPAAFKAVYGTAVGKHTSVSWTDLPIIAAAEKFRDLIVRYDLDRLFMSKDPDARPLEAITHRLTENVQNWGLLRERGIKVYSVTFSKIEMPPAVQKQLIDTWRAHWASEAIKKRNQGEIMGERIMEQARANAQHEMLTGIHTSLREAFSDGGTATKTEIARRLINVLNRAASDPIVQTMLPPDVVYKLNSMRHWAGLEAEQAALSLEHPDQHPPADQLSQHPPEEHHADDE